MKLKETKKNKLLFFMLIAIIVLLFAGIVYEFVCIKKLEGKLNSTNSSFQIVVEENLLQK